jgi:hypothetical protein
MVLHEAEPLKVVGIVWNVLEKQMRFALEE